MNNSIGSKKHLLNLFPLGAIASELAKTGVVNQVKSVQFILLMEVSERLYCNCLSLKKIYGHSSTMN